MKKYNLLIYTSILVQFRFEQLGLSLLLLNQKMHELDTQNNMHFSQLF